MFTHVEPIVQEERIEKIISVLPYGSGFDCKWETKEYKNGNIDFITDFHNMDEFGGYDGYTRIRVKIKACDLYKTVPDFKMYTNGKRKYKWNKEYYEDTIYDALISLRK